MTKRVAAAGSLARDAEDLNRLVGMGFVSLEEVADTGAVADGVRRGWTVVKLPRPRPAPALPDAVPDMPLWAEFGLPAALLAGLSALAFERPTDIQRAFLRAGCSGGRHFVGSAPTGSGKTLAFALPILSTLCREGRPWELPRKDWLRGLILTPTRELAIQVAEHLSAVGRYLPGLRVVPVVGGLSGEKQERLLGTSPPVIVATPGRLSELLESSPGLQAAIAAVPFLVVDEADRMIMDGRGRFPDLERLFGLLRPGNPSRTIFLLSATLSGAKVRGALGTLYRRLGMHKPVQVHVGGGVAAGAGVSEPQTLTKFKVCLLSREDKDRWLFAHLRILRQGPEGAGNSRTLIFVNSIEAVRRFCKVLSALLGPSRVFPLHAQMQQRQRLKRLGQFKSCTRGGILVCSDVAARGLDIPQVELVIQAEPPKSLDIHLHRVGRTARAGAPGTAILLLDPKEAAWLKLRGSEEGLGRLFSGLPDYPHRYEIHKGQWDTLFQTVKELESLLYSSTRANSESRLRKRLSEEVGIGDDSDAEHAQDPRLQKKIAHLQGSIQRQLGSC